jgi:hypothetical protein
MTRTLIAAALIFAFPAAAQSLKTHIPFPFQIGNKQMPSGNYSLERVEQVGNRVFALYHDTGSAAAMVNFAVPQPDASTPQLSFTRLGSSFHLTRVCVAGSCRTAPQHGVGTNAEVATVALGRR